MKVTEHPQDLDAFILGGAEHAIRPPDWFYTACSNMVVGMSRDVNSKLQALMPGGNVAHEGDYVVNGTTGICSYTPDEFNAIYKVTEQ